MTEAACAEKCDNVLLQEYVTAGSDAAINELLHRHGPLVLGVCRRVLGQSQDAEDATQAVFLTLVQKAPSLRNHRSLAAWLHHVAWNISVCARKAAQKRAQREREVGAMTAVETPAIAEWESVKPLLDSEVAALPEKYRLPLLLHHVEGRTQEEIATLLGCTYGALSGRLNHARELLRERLVRRGVTVAPAVLFKLLSDHAAAEVSPALSASTAATLKKGKSSIPGAPQALSREALHTMSLARVKSAAIAAAAAAVLLFGGTAAYLSTRRAPLPAVAKVELETPPVAPPPVVAPAAPLADPRIATWISQLGSDNVPTRVLAMENLRTSGAKAERELNAAAKTGPDAVKQRAATLVGMLGTTAQLRKIGETVSAIPAYEADETGMQLIGGQTVKTSGHLAAMPASKRFSLTGASLAGAMTIRSRLISDGTTVWSEMELSEQTKNISRSSRMDASGSNATLNLDDYRAHYDFVAMREDVLDGKSVLVFSGVIREVIPAVPAAPGPQDPDDLYQPCQTCTACVGKDDLLLHKIEYADDKGIVTRSLTWSGIRTNVKLDAAQFTYTPPPNADVWNTDDQEPAPAAQETAKPAPSKNAEF